MATWKKLLVSGSVAEFSHISSSGNIVPTDNDNGVLGSVDQGWGDLYLADGGSLPDAPDSFNIPDWVKNVYATAPEISFEDHVLMQATFQKHVDSGISKTINFDHSATVHDVEEAYKLAWKTACKGITVYREGSRKKEVLVKGTTEASCCETPQIIMQEGCQSCLSCGWSACLVA
mgnify:CR=1 FL=1